MLGQLMCNGTKAARCRWPDSQQTCWFVADVWCQLMSPDEDVWANIQAMSGGFEIGPQAVLISGRNARTIRKNQLACF